MRLLSLARDLRRRKAREREGLFAAEGVRVVEELLRSPLAITGLLVAPKLIDSPRGVALVLAARERGIDVVDVDEKEFRSAAETDAPQGVLAIAQVPAHSLATVRVTDVLRLLVLDAVQDPGNVGTIIRTAAALGADATIALPGTVDVWNAKVVRSAMGAHFHHPAFHASWEETSGFLARADVPLWAADSGGEPLPASKPLRLAIAVGNEGSGLTAPVRMSATRIVSLPIAPIVESLNVAVAAGILLYELRP
ncbi:23S rRNA (adenosine(1067)-2'-O)-methyltransferase [Gammaproteobacteria bacterium]|nr:23S rRNA (adenosine(1067)-2'-O)-methyltransferase [Gammaproteobacteria bacterium]